MSRLLSSKVIVKTLQLHGFNFVSQRGSHAKFRKTTKQKILTVIVPMNKKEIPYGTFRSIMRQSSLSENEFGSKHKK